MLKETHRFSTLFSTKKRALCEKSVSTRDLKKHIESVHRGTKKCKCDSREKTFSHSRLVLTLQMFEKYVEFTLHKFTQNFIFSKIICISLKNIYIYFLLKCYFLGMIFFSPLIASADSCSFFFLSISLSLYLSAIFPFTCDLSS